MTEAPQVETQAGAQVLIVSDRQRIAQTLVAFINSRGLRARECGTSVAIERCWDLEPALILLDSARDTPRAEAIGRRLRRETCAQSVLIVAIRCSETYVHRARGRSAPFDYYLVGPLDRETIERFVRFASIDDVREENLMRQLITR